MFSRGSNKWREGRITVISLRMITLITIIVIWESIVRGFDISSSIFPTAMDTIISLMTFFVDADTITHLWTTFSETILGFLSGTIVGVITGVLVAEFNFVKRYIYPYLVALNSVPAMALAPLFVVWFGFGMSSTLALIVFATFFPVLINTMIGITSVDDSYIKLLKANSATRWKIFSKVKLPTSLPYIFSGMKIAIVLAVIGSVISGFVGANQGLGFLMLYHHSQFSVSDMFAVLVIISSMGYLLSFCLEQVSRKVIFWKGE